MADTGSGTGRLPLSALLSQVLVAFVIEFDNEFERQMPHRTTDHGRTQGQGKVPWLVSMAMWSTCMRFITTDGITVGELARRARTGTNLAGMQRWGYITIAPDPDDTRPKPPRSGWVIHATPSGRQAQQVWLPLTGVVEQRWAERFGADSMAALNEPLRAVAEKLDPALPDCLPILGYGLWSTPDGRRPKATSGQPRNQAGVRNPLSPGRTPPPCCPGYCWRSRPSSSANPRYPSRSAPMCCASSTRAACASGTCPACPACPRKASAWPWASSPSTDSPSPGRPRTAAGDRWATLTLRGRSVQNKCRERLTEIERRWQARFGGETVTALRAALERLTSGPGSRLSEGLEPPQGGWRAGVRGKATLPPYPMVLHRGGFPDGR